jgi:hypothetical protein
LRRALAGFVLLTCVRVWAGAGPWGESAAAQLPDPALQRRELVREVQRTNGLLGEILRTLQTQPFKVRVEGADKRAGTVPVPGTGTPPEPHGAEATPPGDG